MFALFSLLTLILGGFLTWLVVSLSQAVVQNTADMERSDRERKSVNPAATAGYAIATARDDETQLVEARKVAAKRAAQTARGANMGIGRLGTANVEARTYNSAGAANDDAMSAVKIAKHHTWKGLAYQSPAPAAAATTTTDGATKTVKRKLVPGKDFAWTDIAGLSGGEKRSAIILNARAKAAAYKEMKESGQDMVVEQAVATPAASSASTTAAVPAGLPSAPVLTEITEGMSPDEKRTAKIANSKAKSAYNKALKAMGVDPKTVGEGAAVSAPATPAPVADASPVSGDLPPAPDMIEITDDMSPDEKRSAKIANSKAKSAYKKELKAMGIDPKSVKI